MNSKNKYFIKLITSYSLVLVIVLILGVISILSSRIM